MQEKAKIAEIFTSIQGEGPYVGAKQLFIRFCGCNLSCKYCDTEFLQGNFYSAKELLEKINNYDLKIIHSISLTGGEPLLWTDFLKEFLPLANKKIYLETNATLSKNFLEISDYIDIVSADIKLPSSSGITNSFELHDEFFKNISNKNKIIFAKIVFDENITDEEIKKSTELAKKYNLELILQPKTIVDKVSLSNAIINKTLDKFLYKYSKVRVIPQTHVFLGVE